MFYVYDLLTFSILFLYFSEQGNRGLLNRLKYNLERTVDPRYASNEITFERDGQVLKYLIKMNV